MGYKGTSPTDVVSNASLSITSTLWGITAGIMALKLGHESIFEQETATKVVIEPQKETGLIEPTNYRHAHKHIVPVPARKREKQKR